MRKFTELPDKMKALKLDHRGFPIPYVILIDGSGKPHFVINDTRKVDICIRWKFCAICGTSMKEDMWMVGGLGSAFHQYGVYNDTAVHYECGKYALEICPYLASKNYNKYLDTDKLRERIKGDEVPILVDQTVDPNKPRLFVFQKISGFKIKPKGDGTAYVIPTRPYLAVEFWKDGEQVDFETGVKISAEEGYIVDEKILKK